MIDKSQIEIQKMEPLPNSEQIPIVIPSSPTIGNTPVVGSSGNEDGYYFKEAGKTWWQSVGRSITRVHDENFTGMRFEHKRCPFCNRITSIHTLHWLNHMDKCADEKYSWKQLMELQHSTPKELEDKGYGFIGRE